MGVERILRVVRHPVDNVLLSQRPVNREVNSKFRDFEVFLIPRGNSYYPYRNCIFPCTCLSTICLAWLGFLALSGCRSIMSASRMADHSSHSFQLTTNSTSRAVLQIALFWRDVSQSRSLVLACICIVDRKTSLIPIPVHLSLAFSPTPGHGHAYGTPVSAYCGHKLRGYRAIERWLKYFLFFLSLLIPLPRNILWR